MLIGQRILSPCFSSGTGAEVFRDSQTADLMIRASATDPVLKVATDITSATSQIGFSFLP